MLEEIVFGNYEGGDEDALQIVTDFISGYTIIFPELNEYDYEYDFLSEDGSGIGESSIWFNFCDDEEFPYNADILQKVLDALNCLLGVPIFDKFDVGGHNQSMD